MTRRYLSYQDIHSQTLSLINQMVRDQWRPDYVVGITRGGLLPSVLLSQFFGVCCHTLAVSLRDSSSLPESNCWMAEDAYGYDRQNDPPRGLPKNILIVDDINDTGATLEWIKRDWPSSCLPYSGVWEHVWHNNVRFAVLVNNLASPTSVDYAAMEINKAEHDQWIEFPWENWWITASSQ